MRKKRKSEMEEEWGGEARGDEEKKRMVGGYGEERELQKRRNSEKFLNGEDRMGNGKKE